MNKLIAFHNDITIKTKLLADLAEHAQMDRIVHGQYWENGKGCAVGCTLHSLGEKNTSNHAAYETLLGVPQVIARLEDRIFEGLTNGKAKEWPARFTSAIQPGADLSMVWPRFALWILSEELPKFVQAAKHAKQKAAIEEVAKLYREWCGGAEIGTLRERFREARANAYAAYAAADAAAYAAYAAAAYAADAAYAAAAAAYAAYAAAAYAADAAAYAAAAAAAAAAYAADAAYAYAAAAAYAYAARSRAKSARSLAYERMADKLEELLKTAPQWQKAA